jgi:hypothetical protein
VSVARRPLRAEELAELLAFKRGPFRLFRRGWRQEDLVNAVQTKYLSLLEIVKDGDTTIIQFSRVGQLEVARILIDHGADLNASSCPVLRHYIWHRKRVYWKSLAPLSTAARI